VSLLSYGAWVTMSYQVVQVKAVAELLAACRDNGCNFFDNAEVYAKGDAEILVGKAIRVGAPAQGGGGDRGRWCGPAGRKGGTLVHGVAAGGQSGVLALPPSRSQQTDAPPPPAAAAPPPLPPPPPSPCQELGWKRSDVVLSTKIFWGGEGPNDVGLSRKHIIEGTKVGGRLG
jgi:hypothetical protein